MSIIFRDVGFWLRKRGLEIKQFFSVIFVVLDTQIGRRLKTAKITAELIQVLAALRYPRKQFIYPRYLQCQRKNSYLIPATNPDEIPAAGKAGWQKYDEATFSEFKSISIAGQNSNSNFWWIANESSATICNRFSLICSSK